MTDDHARLDRLLERASAPHFDHEAFEEFRGGLLRKT
jgi:hypothetical protein